MGVGCRAAFLAVLGHFGLSNGAIELIDAGGKLASASEITSLLSGLGGKPMSVVGVVGSRGSGKSTLLNQAFGTDFETGSGLVQGSGTGVCATVAEGLLILDCDGAEEAVDPGAVAGTKTTSAGQAAAFSSAVSDVVVVNLWRSDLGRCVASNVRTIKALFGEKLQVLEGETPEVPTTVLVAVHDCDPEGDVQALQEAVMEEMEAVWEEVEQTRTGGDLEDYFAIKALALPHPKYHSSAYVSMAEGVKENILEAAGAPETTTLGFREKVTSTWTSVREAGASLIPAKSELLAVYKVDGAFGEAMARADGQIKSWRQVVGSGNVIGSFGEKASKLYTSTLKGFDAKTVRYSSTSSRSTKRASLVSVLEGGIKEVYNRQLSMLCVAALRSYKKELLKLFEGENLNEETEADLLRKSLFAFEADATTLVPEALNLSFEDEYEELEADLQEYSEEFQESPAAQVKAMQKVDKGVKKPRGKPTMGVGLGLVGMVRQGGMGSLQGFAGYRAGPHTITMGYANDADLVDVAEEGERPPLLRLQPKLNLDIDL